MDEYLLKMVAGFRALGIESAFPRIHHFSRDEYATDGSRGLEPFLEYCLGREIQGENIQTIHRGLAVVNAFPVERKLDLSRDAIGIDDAIASAWKEYPLVTR